MLISPDPGTIENDGTLTLDGGTIFSNYWGMGSFVNNGSGQMTARGTIDVAEFANYGTLTVSGTFAAAPNGYAENWGQINIGAAHSLQSASFYNDGIVVLGGGSLVAASNDYWDGEIVNSPAA